MKRSYLIALALTMGMLDSRVAPAAGPVAVRENGSRIVLANDFLERTLEVRQDSVRTFQLWNKLSGRTYPLGGDEFELRLTYERIGYEFDSENPLTLTSRDFRVTGRSVEDVAGGKRVVFHMDLRRAAQTGTGLEATLVFELKSGDFFTRQWLALKTTGRGTYFIDWLAVGKYEWTVPELRHGGFGQPLLGEDIFLGLEYPTSLNTMNGSSVTLGSWVGTNVPPEGFTSDPAVIGVAAPGTTHAAFMDYVRHMRVAPERLFVIYNTWYDLQGNVMDDENLLQRVAQLDSALVKKYDVHLDSFVLDDGWSGPSDLWQIDSQRFPHGFHNLATALKPMGSKLGLWYGPIGGYGGPTVTHRATRVAVGRERGLEITSNGEYLCLAGKDYSKYFRDALLQMQKEYDINYFKLDGIPFGCNEPDHGHPLGIYSREADVRVFVNILQALRSQSAEVFLNITTSIWLSPWWLKYADTVWMGGADTGYHEAVPAMTLRQSAITYRDAVIYNDFRRHEAQFPMSSLMTHGIIKGKYNMLGGEHESLDDWKDAVVNALTVGTMLVKLYPTPELLKPDEWDALGRSLQWAGKNAHPLLDNSTFVLGDPGLREAYGFLHFSADKTILTLRNPFIRPVPARVKLDEQSGFERNERTFIAEVVFPFRKVLAGNLRYGDTLQTELEGYEQRVIELRPVRPQEVQIFDVRYSVETPATDGPTLRVYGAEGAEETVRLSNSATYQEAHIDGKKILLTLSGGETMLKVRFGKKGSTVSNPSFSAPSLRLSEASSAEQTLQLSFEVQIPPDFRQSKIALLIEPTAETKNITAQGRDSGHPLSINVENGGGGLWYWFTCEVKPGKHSIDFEIHVPGTEKASAQLSGWLLTKRALVAKELQLTFKPGLVLSLPPENPLPASAEFERKTYALFERKSP